MNPLTQFKTTTILPLLIALTLSFFWLPQLTHAQCPQVCDGLNNTGLGEAALISLTTGVFNTGIGTFALQYNTTGGYNTATGSGALLSNTTGNDNTASGYRALFGDFVNGSTGSNNTATGYQALYSNTTGYDNTANGFDSLYSNTTGNDNTANGFNALLSNTTGSNNTADGFDSLYSNTTGVFNTANGFEALYSNTTGSNNTAGGFGALGVNTGGSNNTATGFGALQNNTSSNNTANGFNALLSNTTGSNNIALGVSAGSNLTTGSNNIDIGHTGIAGESKTIRIGKKGIQTTTVIAGINGVTVSGGIGVLVDSNGRLGTSTSSARFKENIKPMDKASEVILALKPVSFRYKKELDPEGIPQFGLVAEQVEKVNPDLVARDEQGKPYTVRYEAVNAMLLNEFLKEHRKVEEQGTTIAKQQKQIEALTAGLQKVSAELAASKPAPQVVKNP